MSFEAELAKTKQARVGVSSQGLESVAAFLWNQLGARTDTNLLNDISDSLKTLEKQIDGGLFSDRIDAAMKQRVVEFQDALGQISDQYHVVNNQAEELAGEAFQVAREALDNLPETEPSAFEQVLGKLPNLEVGGRPITGDEYLEYITAERKQAREDAAQAALKNLAHQMAEPKNLYDSIEKINIPELPDVSELKTRQRQDFSTPTGSLPRGGLPDNPTSPSLPGGSGIGGPDSPQPATPSVSVSPPPVQSVPSVAPVQPSVKFSNPGELIGLDGATQDYQRLADHASRLRDQLNLPSYREWPVEVQLPNVSKDGLLNKPYVMPVDAEHSRVPQNLAMRSLLDEHQRKLNGGMGLVTGSMLGAGLGGAALSGAAGRGPGLGSITAGAHATTGGSAAPLGAKPANPGSGGVRSGAGVGGIRPGTGSAVGPAAYSGSTPVSTSSSAARGTPAAAGRAVTGTGGTPGNTRSSGGAVAPGASGVAGRNTTNQKGAPSRRRKYRSNNIVFWEPQQTRIDPITAQAGTYNKEILEVEDHHTDTW